MYSVSLDNKSPDFGSRPHTDLYLGIFKRIFQPCGVGHFARILAVISGKTDRILVKILSQMYLCTRKSTRNCWSHADLESTFGPELPQWSSGLSVARVIIIISISSISSMCSSSSSCCCCCCVTTTEWSTNACSRSSLK